MPVYSAIQLLEKLIITCRGAPVGTATACDPRPAAPNYEECFVRDLVLPAMWRVFLLRAYVRTCYWMGRDRLNFRFFAMGNLLAILMGLASEDEAQAIMRLYHHRWDQLVGEMPLKIVYPAVEDREWQFMTGSDPKNAPWSCHEQQPRL